MTVKDLAQINCETKNEKLIKKEAFMSTNKKNIENHTSSLKDQSALNKHLNWPEVEVAKNDMNKFFGFVPSFMGNIPEQGLPGAWNEAKQLRFSSNTVLDTKLKALICLSVSSQIPCEMIGYFEKKAASVNGISIQQQFEAVTITAILRHWSTVINGSQIDKTLFKKEVDNVMAHIKKMMDESNGKLPKEDLFLVMPTSPKEAYLDIEKTLGHVPKFFQVFPEESISAAWSEFKGIQLNPHTALTGKEKELIGLAIAAQIPCDYCIYFHRAAAVLNNASVLEMQEAISLAATTRHWSVLLNSPLTDPIIFKKEADQMIANSFDQKIH